MKANNKDTNKESSHLIGPQRKNLTVKLFEMIEAMCCFFSSPAWLPLGSNKENFFWAVLVRRSGITTLQTQLFNRS